MFRAGHAHTGLTSQATRWPSRFLPGWPLLHAVDAAADRAVLCPDGASGHRSLAH